MNIKQLEAFVYIAEEKNFTKAAKLLFMTQPAISFQIKALEENLGIQLFERLEKKVFLTEGGKILYPEAKNILQAYEKVKDDIIKFKGIQKGSLVIGASTIPGEYILPELIGKFKLKYPSLIFSLEIGSTVDILAKLEERQLDIAVIGALPENNKFETFQMAEDELVLIAAQNFLYEEISTDKLESLQFIFREIGSGTRKIIEQKLLEVGISFEKLDIQMELGSTRAILTAVEAGLGLSFVSRWAIQEALQLNKVKIIAIKGLGPIRRTLYGAINPQKYNTSIAKAFQAFITLSHT